MTALSGSNNFGTANELFKIKYADSLINLLPSWTHIQNRVAFEASKKLGKSFQQPVTLATENGFNYLGEAGTAQSLTVEPSASTTKMAELTGSECNLRAYMSYAAITRAQESEASFVRETKYTVKNMTESFRKRLEIMFLHGQKDLGVVEAVALSTDTYVKITEATWAAGMWSGMEGASIIGFTGSTIQGAAHKIAKVKTSTRELIFTGDVTADYAVGDTLHFEGSRVSGGGYNEAAGLNAILTTTGNLFGIATADWSLWQGNSVSSVGPLNLDKVQDYVTLAVDKGLMGKTTLLLNPKAWAKLASDQAALRQYDSSYSTEKAKAGFKGLALASQNGEIEVLAHPFVKQGEAFLVPLDLCARIGSVDLSFALPGQEGVYFDRVAGYTAVQLQAMSDQALFLEKPAHCVYLSGITY